jgi:competence CoiA-like predicted nuclease
MKNNYNNNFRTRENMDIILHLANLEDKQSQSRYVESYPQPYTWSNEKLNFGEIGLGQGKDNNKYPKIDMMLKAPNHSLNSIKLPASGYIKPANLLHHALQYTEEENGRLKPTKGGAFLTKDKKVVLSPTIEFEPIEKQPLGKEKKKNVKKQVEKVAKKVSKKVEKVAKKEVAKKEEAIKGKYSILNKVI